MLNQVLFPVIIVATIGLIAGIILVLASIFMSVPENKKVKEILNVLPGANCGACGYSGCEGYAKALAEKTAKIGLCAPGGKTVSDKISEILGNESMDDVEQKKAFIKCNGTFKNTSKKTTYNGINSCAAAKLFFGGDGSCKYGCLGFGDCLKKCPYGAISIRDGVAYVSLEKCVGCGICVKTCPKNIIDLVPLKDQAVVLCSNKDKGIETRKSCTVGCIGCMRCVKECPNGAISVENFIAKVDPAKCTHCKKCLDVCAPGCLNDFLLNK